MNILVAEESANIQRSMKSELQVACHSVVLASSGTDAMNSVNKTNIDAAYGNSSTAIDLIIISMMAHGASAPQTIRNIRKRGFLGLLIGAWCDGACSADVSDMKTNGAQCVLVKPFSIQKFNKAVADVKAYVSMRRRHGVVSGKSLNAENKHCVSESTSNALTTMCSIFISRLILCSSSSRRARRARREEKDEEAELCLRISLMRLRRRLSSDGCSSGFFLVRLAAK